MNQIKLSDIESRIKSEEQKQNRLLDALLNGSITQPIFANKKSEIEQNITNLERERAMYKSADKNFKNAVITAFQLASRLHDIFLVSKNCEKREIINFVFSNLKLNGENLVFTLKKPFDLMVNLSQQPTWLPLGTTLRTESYGDVIQYGQKLKLMKVDLRELQLVA
jgi:hypothetical protein